MKAKLKRALERLGVHVGRHRHTLAGAREEMLRSGEIDLVIDVGAHAGEYGTGLRAAGYAGKILSFEPVSGHFERLLAASAGDGAWECLNRAGGARSEEATISISANDGFSSSLLEMTEAHENAAHGSHFAEAQTIDVVSLDEAVQEPRKAHPSWYLKADTQGYEHEVLAGAEETLRQCLAVELELSLTPIYEGQLLLGEMIELMREKGFRATHLEPEFVDPNSGELLCVNGLFQVCKDQRAPHGQ
jgi:FkbM family methyltransferase